MGCPDGHSPVLVTSNYKMTVDRVRENLAGRDTWILVLDTEGINVWCAAGKGTFGTDELVSRIESASYRLKYAFPTDFSEELEAAFSKNVHGLMRLHWVQEYVQQEVMRLSDEIAETPDDPRLWLQHQNALSVLLHAAAFDKWAQEQQTRQIEFQRDLRSAGPLPTWELENIHFEPKPAPKYENFINGSHHNG